MHEDACIGTAGIVPSSFLHPVSEGYAFAFELDASWLRTYKQPLIRYKPASKYPVVERDVSMFVPLSTTVDEVTRIITAADIRIANVTLVDFFEKKEWHHQRSLTIRFVIRDEEKTLKKEEVDTIFQTIVTQLTNCGATIR